MKNKIESKRELNSVKILRKNLTKNYLKNSKILKNGKPRG